MVGERLDREACELITKNESPHFEQDLAELIKTPFQDVLDQMSEMQRDHHDDEDDYEEETAEAK